jgi:hypothetical protein
LSLLLALTLVLSLPSTAFASWWESGTTKTCPGKILCTRIYATGTLHWHKVNGSLHYLPTGTTGWTVSYEYWGPAASSYPYSLGHSEDGPLPYFSKPDSYPSCV